MFIGLNTTAFAKSYYYQGKGNEIWEQLQLKAGDTVVIKNGQYNNLKINVKGKGSQQKPITLRAETPGKVVLSGESWIRYWGAHVVVEGFDFRDIKYSVYEGKTHPIVANRKAVSSSKSSEDMCYGCVLQHIRIDKEIDAALDKKYKWVEIYGYENIIRHNYFGAKKSESRVLQLQLKHANAEKKPVDHIIYANYFASRNEGAALGNGGEALLIGESKMQHVDAKVIVEGNLFYDAAITGEPEVISNKSSSNIYRYNTIRNTSAGLTLRHGNRNTVEKNWVLQANKEGSAGIRSIGSDNVIRNNYIANIKATTQGYTQNYRPALGLVAAYSEYFDKKHRNGYQLTARNILDKNTVIASEQPVMLSTWYNRKKLDVTRPPKDITFTNNLVFQLDTPPTNSDWVRGQAISVDFTTQSNYANKNGANKAEYDPNFVELKGNLTDGDISKLVENGTEANSNKTLKGCDAFSSGDLVYEALDGAGADLSLMRAPLYWTDSKKSAKLGPQWLNQNWNDEADTYSPCA